MQLKGRIDEDKLYICRPIPNDEQRRFAPVGVLSRYTDEDCQELWTIEPIWDNYKSIKDGGYGFDIYDDEIFSCNMELGLNIYEFEDYIPGIVEKRTPTRANAQDLIDKYNLRQYDVIDILKITKGLSNDKFAFLPYSEEYFTPFKIKEIEEYGMSRLMFEV